MDSTDPQDPSTEQSATAPAPAPTPSSAPSSRTAKPVPVGGSAKTGGDPLKASGKKPDAPLPPESPAGE